ncbi:hypothetical protein G6F56_004036 [Rhizopus delemar]|nr:hypothetical protein G6F56_004036 [Rhizopus delemar]
MSAILKVFWQGKEFPVEYSNVQELYQATVKDLKGYCSRVTGIESHKINLLAFGAVMNNDDMQLKAYGIRPESRIMLRESNRINQTERTKEEQVTIERLETIKKEIDIDIAPQVKEYEKDIKEFMTQTIKTEKEKDKQIYKAAYLGEQLMHILFNLDGISCGQDFLEARRLRKEAVKVAQTLLDKVDDIKSILKSVKE